MKVFTTFFYRIIDFGWKEAIPISDISNVFIGSYGREASDILLVFTNFK